MGSKLIQISIAYTKIQYPSHNNEKSLHHADEGLFMKSGYYSLQQPLPPFISYHPIE